MRWRCPDCGDEMDEVSRASHAERCKMIHELLAPDLDRFLAEVLR